MEPPGPARLRAAEGCGGPATSSSGERSAAAKAGFLKLPAPELELVSSEVGSRRNF